MKTNVQPTEKKSKFNSLGFWFVFYLSLIFSKKHLKKTPHNNTITESKSAL